MTYELIGNVKYYKKDNYYIVGDNSTTSGNGISSTSYQGKIVILEKVKGLDVLEVGKYSFDCCSKITNVTIHAKIRSINKGAFYRCTGLTHVNIPASVTFLGEGSFNLGTGAATVDINITFEFNEGRKENIFLDHQSLCRRKNVFIIYPSNLLPLYSGDVFMGATSVTVCSKYSFTFVSKKTTDLSKCPSPIYINDNGKDKNKNDYTLL